MISEFEKSPPGQNSRLAGWLATGWMTLVLFGFVVIRLLGSHSFRSLHLRVITR